MTAPVSTLDDAALETLRRQVRSEMLERAGKSHACTWCSNEFTARADARYCSGRCRTAMHRHRRKGKST